MKHLHNIFGRYPVVCVYLFGSHAKNQQIDNSDYDFGIILQEGISDIEILNIRLALLKELLRYLKNPVDIVIMNSKGIPLSLKFRIIKEGQIIYCQDDLSRSRFETRILSLYLDHKYYYERHTNEVLENFARGELVD
ncbi:MAG: type VII toxin-antitoxin system MntA family adenylyltransferase antitoxin [bacterium]